MAPALNRQDRNRALTALKTAEAFIQGVRDEVDDDAKTLVDRVIAEGDRMQKASVALVFGLLTNEYTPAELFKPWASVRRIQQWRDDPAVNLDVIIRHGKTCVKPSAFFAHWQTLKDESKPRTLSAEQSVGATPSSLGGRNGVSVRPAKAGRG